MEIINIPGYTEEEKIIIARDFLVPKQKKENGLDEYNVSITDDALRAIIRNYTREAGVRGLERGISSILRKIARKVVSENLEDFEIIVDENDVLEYLGVPKYLSLIHI